MIRTNNLRKLRLKKKLTCRQVAHELGVTLRAIYFWESGERKPELEYEEKLAQLYNVSEIQTLYKKP